LLGTGVAPWIAMGVGAVAKLLISALQDSAVINWMPSLVLGFASILYSVVTSFVPWIDCLGMLVFTVPLFQFSAKLPM
jgi:hypothetical protein